MITSCPNDYCVRYYGKEADLAKLDVNKLYNGTEFVCLDEDIKYIFDAENKVWLESNSI